METLQPVRFDSFTPLPIREILVMFKTPSGLIKKMPARPQSGTVWRFDDRGNNKDNWKAQLYQWVEPGEKNSDSRSRDTGVTGKLVLPSFIAVQ